MITQEELKEKLYYNNEIFIWKNNKNLKVGNNYNGYNRIYINGKSYYAHKLVWLYIYGYYPKTQIKFLDGNKSNISINNLEETNIICKGNSKNKNKKVILEYNRLKEVLDYDKNNGIFKWKIEKGRKCIGDVAGSYNKKSGYITIKIDQNPYAAHRLAWLYIYGYYPENYIDHINRKSYDNRIKNLREVSNQCNIRNTGNFSSNTSMVKGVSLDRNNKWRTRIKLNGKEKLIGSFNDFDEAVCHRLAVEQCLNWKECDDNSPAFKYVKERITKGEYNV